MVPWSLALLVLGACSLSTSPDRSPRRYSTIDEARTVLSARMEDMISASERAKDWALIQADKRQPCRGLDGEDNGKDASYRIYRTPIGQDNGEVARTSIHQLWQRNGYTVSVNAGTNSPTTNEVLRDYGDDDDHSDPSEGFHYVLILHHADLEFHGHTSCFPRR